MRVPISFRLMVGIIFVTASLLAVTSCACSPAPPTGATQDIEITMDRGACNGFCPAYNVTIHGDGRVIYEGGAFVEVTGRQESQIDPVEVERLAKEFQDVGYFSLEDSYTGGPTCLTTVTTSITVNGESKSVSNYYGAPDELHQLEDRIDKVAGTAQWIG